MRRFDLIVVGGGINGAGIARDAAGRGLSVALIEKDDLAAHTSSASSKLVHGGLRYLEYYEFKLVAEALAERRILLSVAPHIVRPMTFVLPHEPHLRPAWMIRAGLAFYDLFGARGPLAHARSIDLRSSDYGKALKPDFRRGFTYSDAWVDDARLVVLNARAAADRGALVLTRTRCSGAAREGGEWRVRLQSAGGSEEVVGARALVNAAGPWAQAFIERELGGRSPGRLRLVKGSHIAVPRLYPGEHAYILQNPDRRVIFLVPYGENLTAIGTTDVPVADSEYTPVITDAEIAYLASAASRYTARAITPADVVNTWSGVRALYDDGDANPSAVTREYRLLLDAPDAQVAPLLSIFGGKITTYRSLAERALGLLRPYFPQMGPKWTDTAPLPGGDFAGRSFGEVVQAAVREWSDLDPNWLRSLARRHGTRLNAILAGVRSARDLGPAIVPGLFECELRYLLDHEWATTADDVLWRRTKAGLDANPVQTQALAQAITDLSQAQVPVPAGD